MAGPKSDDDSPQQILATFAPYLEQGLFPTLRFSRDTLQKEIKSTTPIYADWALHVFKSLYPTTGAGLTGFAANGAVPLAADDSGSAKVRIHPLNCILEWESVLQDYRKVTAAAASTDESTAAESPQPGKKSTVAKSGKAGKNKKTSKPSTPSGSTSNVATPANSDAPVDFASYASGVTLLKHLLNQWIAQPSRLSDWAAMDPCDLSDLLANVCSSLQFMSPDQVAAALAADQAERAERPTRKRTANGPDGAEHQGGESDEDEDEDEDDGPFTETIFHTLTFDKAAFQASSERIVDLLQRDEEIQIIDPEELLRPAQVEQERDIVNARIAQFNRDFAKVLATVQSQAWAFPKKVLDLAEQLDKGYARVTGVARQLPATVVAWGGNEAAQRVFDFDVEWGHVVNMYKVKRKSVDPGVIDVVNTRFESMVQGLVANHKKMCTDLLPALVNQLVQLAEALAKNSAAKLPQLDTSNAHLDAEGQAPPSADALQDSLAAECSAMMDSVRQGAEALRARLEAEHAAVVAESESVLATFSVAVENPLTVGHRLDRAAKGDVRKQTVRLVKMMGNSVQSLVDDLLEKVFPLAKLHAFVLKWLALSMLLCEVIEARVLAMTDKQMDDALQALLDRRDEVVNLYQDGLEAGIRTLDLSMRNVVLDEMTTLAATQRAKDKERELFDDGPANSSSRGKKKKKQKPKAEAAVAVTSVASPAPKSQPAGKPANAGTAAPPASNKGKKSKVSSPAPPAAKSEDSVHSSTSIDGVERTIPKELLAVMGSPVPRRTSSGISRTSNSPSPVPRQADSEAPKSTVSEPQPVAPKSKTAADALFASAALTAEPEVTLEAGDDGDATPFADSNSRTMTPAASHDEEEHFATEVSPQEVADVDVHALIQENLELREALLMAQTAAHRAESAVAQLMAEHGRLSELRQRDQDAADRTIKELRGQVARLSAEVHSMRSREASPKSSTVSPPGAAAPAAYRMFGPGPSAAAAATPGPPGLSGAPPGLASGAAPGMAVDPWAVPFATGPAASPRGAGGLPPGFGAPIRAPTPGAVGTSSASMPTLAKSPSGSKLDELNQDSVPAHPVRSSHHRHHHQPRHHHPRDNNSDHPDHSHRHHAHHRKGAAQAEDALAEAGSGDPHAGHARKGKWSSQTNQVRCAKCFARGHASEACPVTCSKCGQTGHLARMCTAEHE